jgi:hypothetical protein
MIKLARMILWQRRVTLIKERRNTKKILLGKLEWKRPLRRQASIEEKE